MKAISNIFARMTGMLTNRGEHSDWLGDESRGGGVFNLIQDCDLAAGRWLELEQQIGRGILLGTNSHG